MVLPNVHAGCDQPVDVHSEAAVPLTRPHSTRQWHLCSVDEAIHAGVEAIREKSAQKNLVQFFRNPRESVWNARQNLTETPESALFRI
jgi:hypothetical protein